MKRFARHILTAWAVAMVAALCAVAPLQASAGEQRTVPLLVVVAEFDGGDGGSPVPYDDSYDWGATVFDSEDSPAAYYLEMSQGSFTFAPAREMSQSGAQGNHNGPDQANDGVVHVTLHEAHGAWGTVNDDAAVAQEFGKVVLRAFDAASACVDYESFDRNGDRVLTADELVVCMCIAGYDASSVADFTRSDVPLLWPHSGVLSPSGSSGALQPDSYIAFAEHLWSEDGPIETAAQESPGVLFHELGHSVGLPDLYPLNIDPESAAWGAYSVGQLSLMDSGGWAEIAAADGSRSSIPTALDAWCRYVLGWVTPVAVTSSGDYEVRSQLSDEGYQALLVPTADPDEYYLVENRQFEGRDEALAGEYAGGSARGGIVVWHIDKGSYRQFNAANEVNNTTHRPAVMEAYFEQGPDGTYTFDWVEGAPNTFEPFYDAESCAINYGNASTPVLLPLYDDDPTVESPSLRFDSGTTLTFPFDTAREMIVHVELSPCNAKAASRAYPLEGLATRTHSGETTVADVACAALMRETEADVAFVGGSDLAGGLPQGDLGWEDAYGVLPGDSAITCYKLTGEQLVDLLEESAGAYMDALETGSATDAVFFGGVGCVIDAGAQPGSRVADVAIDAQDIELDGEYYVAVTEGVRSRSRVLALASPDISMLWGSPADALRSFVLGSDWEEAAERLASAKVYLGFDDGEETRQNSASAVEGPFVVLIVVCIVVLLAVAAAVVAVSVGRHRRE